MRSEKVSSVARANRKTSKPIMERKRRARINASLTELKSMLVESTKEEGDRHNKMEKADILEMTVKQLKDMQSRSATGTTIQIDHKQHLGFSECAQTVERYLSTLDECGTDIKKRLLEHLSKCVPGHTSCHSEPSTFPTNSATLGLKNFDVTKDMKTPHHPELTATPSVVDINNNNASTSPVVQPSHVMSSVRVIPITVTSGDVAFILPANITGSGCYSNYVVPVYNLGSQPPTPASDTASSPPTVNADTSRVPSDVLSTNIGPNEYVIERTVPHEVKTHASILPWLSAGCHSGIARSFNYAKSDVWRPW